MPEPSFSPPFFAFLRDLKAHNNRDWFQANKARYENDVVEEALRFISEVGPGLREISPHLLAIPKRVGGSMFRIYRDVRFSKDKSPYKTHVGIQFRHRQAKDAYAPGLYLHLDPDEVFVGAGIWHPPAPVLRKLRDAMMEDPAAWTTVREDPTLAKHFELAGDSLVRPPRGVAADHPLVEDLKRKDLIAVAKLRPEEVTAPGFRDQFLTLCRAARPLPAFICKALGVPF